MRAFRILPHTGVGTLVHHGGMPMRYSSDGKRQVVLESVRAFIFLRFFYHPLCPLAATKALRLWEYVKRGITWRCVLVRRKGDAEGNLIFQDVTES